VSMTVIPDRFTALPGEPALQATVVALEEHGFSAEVAGDLDAARRAVLARIPAGSLVMTSTSVMLDQTGGAANVIFVADAHKLVPTLAAAQERIYQHSLPLEDARAQAAYGQHSQVGKILEIHTELPGRIHVVLIRQPVGY
jgi:hypothetical protein